MNRMTPTTKSRVTIWTNTCSTEEGWMNRNWKHWIEYLRSLVTSVKTSSQQRMTIRILEKLISLCKQTNKPIYSATIHQTQKNKVKQTATTQQNRTHRVEAVIAIQSREREKTRENNQPAQTDKQTDTVCNKPSDTEKQTKTNCDNPTEQDTQWS